MIKKTNRLIFNISMLLLLGAGVVLYWNVFSSIVASIVFAYMLNPAVNWIESHGISRIFSIVSVYAVIALVLGISMLVVMPKVFSQGENIFSYINKSNVVKQAIGVDEVEVVEAEPKDSQIINIFLNYDDEQQKLVLDTNGKVFKDSVFADSLASKPVAVANAQDSTLATSINQIYENPLITQLYGYIRDVDETITFIDIRSELKNLGSTLKDRIVEVPKILLTNLEKVASMFAFIFMIPLVGFFLLKDMHLFSKMFNRFIPNRTFEMYMTISHRINELVSSFLRALFVEVLIVAVLVSIVLSIIGVNYSILIGLLAGIANMVPYFGPFFGVIFAIVSVIFSGQDLSMILYVIIGMWGVQVVDNNVIYPIVIGKSTNMHPLHVFLTVVAGGYLFGVLGMILSVPVVYIVSEITKELYNSLKKYDII